MSAARGTTSKHDGKGGAVTITLTKSPAVSAGTHVTLPPPVAFVDYAASDNDEPDELELADIEAGAIAAATADSKTSEPPTVRVIKLGPPRHAHLLPPATAAFPRSDSTPNFQAIEDPRTRSLKQRAALQRIEAQQRFEAEAKEIEERRRASGCYRAWDNVSSAFNWAMSWPRELSYGQRVVQLSFSMLDGLGAYIGASGAVTAVAGWAGWSGAVASGIATGGGVIAGGVVFKLTQMAVTYHFRQGDVNETRIEALSARQDRMDVTITAKALRIDEKLALVDTQLKTLAAEKTAVEKERKELAARIATMDAKDKERAQIDAKRDAASAKMLTEANTLFNRAADLLRKAEEEKVKAATNSAAAGKPIEAPHSAPGVRHRSTTALA